MKILAQIELIPMSKRGWPSGEITPIEKMDLPIVILEHSVPTKLRNGKPSKKSEKVAERLIKESQRIFDKNFKEKCHTNLSRQPHAKLVVSITHENEQLCLTHQ